MILFFLLCFLIISASLSLPMHPRAILGYLKPKYSKLIEEVQVDLLMEDEPGIYGCLAFLKTK